MPQTALLMLVRGWLNKRNGNAIVPQVAAEFIRAAG
jgi:hypothetical protein